MTGRESGSADVERLASELRNNPALLAKAEIALVADVLGPTSWHSGPGDDGAVVPLSPPADGISAVVCGEALLPRFVAHDPYGAGLAAVVANVNDVAAMGAVPRGIVNTIVGSRDIARQILRGLQYGSSVYRVPLVGGHLTITEGAPALSAFAIGAVHTDLSATRVAAGQSLVVAACTQGSMRADFPFFASFSERGEQLGDDLRLLPALAESGTVVAAKDISMAGLIGSLAMLLEHHRLGITVDLDAVPRPDHIDLERWLMCFPAFGFLLCVPTARVEECEAAFHQRGLAAATVGQIDASGMLRIRRGGATATVLDLHRDPVTGLLR